MTSRHTRLTSAPFLLVSAFAISLSGCQASVSADAKASTGTEANVAEVNFDAEDGDTGSEADNAAWETTKNTQSEAQTETAAPAATPQNTALLGARHDLLIREGSPASCQCLAVALGQPTSEHLVWTGRRPVTNAGSQLVIALGSEGVACSQKGGGASYMGYEQKGADVIVNVEAAMPGRPVTRGAIIPKPQEGGQVYVRPVGKIPYGKGLGGEARCAVSVAP